VGRKGESIKNPEKKEPSEKKDPPTKKKNTRKGERFDFLEKKRAGPGGRKMVSFFEREELQGEPDVKPHKNKVRHLLQEGPGGTLYNLGH